MSIPPYIVDALKKIRESDHKLATALITVISNVHKMPHEDILLYCCRCQNRTMQGLGEMYCSNPYLQAVSSYLMSIARGATKGPSALYSP